MGVGMSELRQRLCGEREPEPEPEPEEKVGSGGGAKPSAVGWGCSGAGPWLWGLSGSP